MRHSVSDGYSRMDANMPIEKVKWTNIEVD